MKDLETACAALYDGGWNSADREYLIACFDLSEDEADAICDGLKRYERS